MNHVTSCKSLELVPWSDSLQACTVRVVLCSHTAVGHWEVLVLRVCRRSKPDCKFEEQPFQTSRPVSRDLALDQVFI